MTYINVSHAERIRDLNKNISRWTVSVTYINVSHAERIRDLNKNISRWTVSVTYINVSHAKRIRDLNKKYLTLNSIRDLHKCISRRDWNEGNTHWTIS